MPLWPPTEYASANIRDLSPVPPTHSIGGPQSRANKICYWAAVFVRGGYSLNNRIDMGRVDSNSEQELYSLAGGLRRDAPALTLPARTETRPGGAGLARLAP
jgi:hypothetical protein